LGDEKVRVLTDTEIHTMYPYLVKLTVEADLEVIADAIE